MKKAAKAGKQMAKQGNGGGQVAKAGANAAVAVAKTMRAKAPVVRMEKGATVITHRELVGNITGTDAFSIAASIALNPGLAATFPWLSQVARNFDQYNFRKLRAHFVPRCATSQAGGVYVAVDPKSSDVPPTSEGIMGSYHNLVEDAPWKEMILDVAKEILHTTKKKYIRTTTLSAADITSLYDVGRLLVAVVGFGGNFAAGKLYIEYEVELFEPSLTPYGGVESGSIDGAGGGLLPNFIFGNAPVSFGLLIASVNGSAVVLQNCVVGAEYYVALYIIGTGITAINPISLVNMTTKSNQAIVNAGSTVGMLFYTFTAGAANPSFFMSVTAVSITDSNLVVARLEPLPAF